MRGLFSEYPLGYCVQEFNFLSREIVMKMMELCKITFTTVRSDMQWSFVQILV